MNETIRSLSRGHIVRRSSSSWELNWITVALMVAVLISAFAVVYVKDLNRRLFLEYQQLQAEHNQLYVNWGKLLLEQSTWSAQQRVQSIAESRLQMMMPKQVVMINIS